MIGPLVTLEEIARARARITGAVACTPLVALADPAGAARGPALLLKAENLQPVGSFKARGALNRIATLTPEERARGVVAHSSGNHAQAVAWAATRTGTRAVIVMPRSAPAVKLARTRALGAEVVLVGDDSDERERECARIGAERGLALVPPFDHPDVIAGQGTVGLEILEQEPAVDLVLVPVSGGGLISGVAAAVKRRHPAVKVVGVEPELAADARASLREGRIVTLPAEEVARTRADGLRARRLAASTFAHVEALVDDVVTVGEDDILAAMHLIATGARLVAEPSGAVAAAAWLFHRQALPAAERPVAVLSGGNVDPALLAEALAR